MFSGSILNWPLPLCVFMWTVAFDSLFGWHTIKLIVSLGTAIFGQCERVGELCVGSVSVVLVLVGGGSFKLSKGICYLLFSIFT